MGRHCDGVVLMWSGLGAAFQRRCGGNGAKLQLCSGCVEVACGRCRGLLERRWAVWTFRLAV